MKNTYLLVMGLFAVAGFAAINSCSVRTPYDATQPPPVQIQGQIMLTTLNGGTAVGGIPIQVVAPNGVSSTTTTATTLAAGGLQIGQAVFKESQTGYYRIQIPGQPAANPSYQTIQLTAALPYVSTTVQTTGATLTISPADSLPMNYTYAAESRVFSVTYMNGSAIQQDVTLLNGFMPANWSASFQTTNLKAGQSTLMYVYHPKSWMADSTPLTVYGMVGPSAAYTAVGTLNRGWSVSLEINSPQVGSAGCTGAGYKYWRDNAAVTGLDSDWTVSMDVTGMSGATGSGTYFCPGYMAGPTIFPATAAATMIADGGEAYWSAENIAGDWTLTPNTAHLPWCTPISGTFYLSKFPLFQTTWTTNVIY